MKHLDDIGILLAYLNSSNRTEDINITLPYSNNLLEEIDNCFVQLGKILVYQISPDLFEIIRHSKNYEGYKETLCYYDSGRKISLSGKYLGSRVLIDSALTYHNSGWLVSIKSYPFKYTKHRLIIS